jgi:Ca2+/Na+ antiporter
LGELAMQSIGECEKDKQIALILTRYSLFLSICYLLLLMWLGQYLAVTSMCAMLVCLMPCGYYMAVSKKLEILKELQDKEKFDKKLKIIKELQDKEKNNGGALS